jgi:hypothetical protein
LLQAARSKNTIPIPFALSLSKGCPSFSQSNRKKGQGFDKLSPNGVGLKDT